MQDVAAVSHQILGVLSSYLGVFILFTQIEGLKGAWLCQEVHLSY